MKFSNEAMRDVLLFIEEKQKYIGDEEYKRLSTYNINMIINDDYFDNLYSRHKYSKDELHYTIEKMVEGRILNIEGNSNTYWEISDISFYGLQLLEKIRPESIWEKTKSLANRAGNHTLNFIEDTAQKIAVTATAAIIGNYANGNK